MKTAGKENPNRCAITRQRTELLGRKLEASLLNQAGWKARKHPAMGKYFFLTFPFIELSELRTHRVFFLIFQIWQRPFFLGDLQYIRVVANFVSLFRPAN